MAEHLPGSWPRLLSVLQRREETREELLLPAERAEAEQGFACILSDKECRRTHLRLLQGVYRDAIANAKRRSEAFRQRELLPDYVIREVLLRGAICLSNQTLGEVLLNPFVLLDLASLSESSENGEV